MNGYESQGITAQVAYALVKTGKLKEAVVTLEYGLAQMLNESLAKERANLDELKKTHKELYTRYWNIRNEWRQLTEQSVTGKNSAPQKELTQETFTDFIQDKQKTTASSPFTQQEGSLHSVQLGKSYEDFTKSINTENSTEFSEETQLALRPIHEKWKTIIDNIRKIVGYEKFLSFDSIENMLTNLEDIVKNRSLVYILSTSAGGLAILVQENGIIPIWLPKLSENDLLQHFEKEKKDKKPWSIKDSVPAYFEMPDNLQKKPWPNNPFTLILKVTCWLLQTRKNRVEKADKSKEFLDIQAKQNNDLKRQNYFRDYDNKLISSHKAQAAEDQRNTVKKEKASNTVLAEAEIYLLQANDEKEKAHSKWTQTLNDTTHWVGEVIMLPIVEALPSSGKVTLVPVELLGLLPLHAAWAYNKLHQTGKYYVADKLTISYAPNAQVLKEADLLAQHVKSDKLLAIENPGNDLSTAKLEIETIQTLFSNYKVLSQQEATKNSVLKALPDYNVLHFSCHGYNDFQKPLQSGLLMANHQQITLEEILKKRLKARLVTLSACETGLPGTTLPDEVVSLSAGLLQTGLQVLSPLYGLFLK